MVDFLKANPFVSMEDYLWKYSMPLIRIMGMDNSHVNYLTDKEKEVRKHKTVDTRGMSVNELNNDLGVKINFPQD